MRRVPLDLYGHSPTEVPQYKTWTGFFFSLLVVFVVAVSVGYVVYEYITLPYDLAQSIGLYDPELLLAPETDVPVPECGVQVVTSNVTFLDVAEYPEVVDIFFWQNIILGDGAGGQCPGKFEGERCRKRVRIPSERCRYHGEAPGDIHVNAFCPQWGYFEENLDEFGILTSRFMPTGDRENASFPALQGNFQDDTYMFMEAEIILNLTGIERFGPQLEIDLADIFGGQIAYICAFNRYSLFDIGIDDPLKLKFVRWSQSVEIKEYLSSKMDVPFQTRDISKGNFVVDFDFLEGGYADVVIGNVKQELDDATHIPSLFALQNSTNNLPLKFNDQLGEFENKTAPETLTLSKAFFHIDRDARRIHMTPPSTIFDILGLIGGFLSLFSLLIGWPAMVINQVMFSRDLKKARKRGSIPDDYLDRDGSVKVDKASEVLDELHKIYDSPPSSRKNLRVWMKKKKSSTKKRNSNKDSETAPAPALASVKTNQE
ncbi:hypothetical protein BSKO_06523 [Bryopsis sp. KO-2023]|nr:hypothetical protein BSKO_06523 [Bryopsis sp. KO-2023]